MADERIRAVGDLEQAYSDLNKELEISKKKVKNLTVEVDTLEESEKKLTEQTKAYKDVLSSLSDPKNIKQLKEQQELYQKVSTSVAKTTITKKKLSEEQKKLEKEQKREIDLRKKLESTVKGERDEIIKLQEQVRRATKESRDNAKAVLDQSDAYETLRMDTDKAQKEFKRLAVQFGINSKEDQEARIKFERLDEELREVNSAARDGRRDVGRYGDAIRGVRDTTLRYTAAITGAAASMVGLFNATNEQDQINKRLKNGFDLTGESLENVSKQVEFLAKSYDTEVNEVIETATAVTNEFGISSENAFNLIEEGFSKGANVRGEFLEQLKEYSTQFVSVGLNAEEAISIITQQENSGVFSDKGVDAIKEAGLRLTEMPKSTEEALDMIGLTGSEIQKQIVSGQKTVFEVTQEISREIAKLPPNATEVGTVLADVFGGAGEDAKGFVLNLGNLSTELGNLEETTTDFEKAQQKITKQFIEIKQEITNALIPAFTFLANNFKTIVSIGGRILEFWIAYQIQLKASRILNSKFITSLKDMSGKFKDVIKGGESAKKAFKGVGSALKTIGWTAAITGAIELGKAFWDVAIGARQARYDAEQLDIQMGKVNKRVDSDIEKRKKELQQKLELAKTDEERLKLQKDFNRVNKEKESQLQKELELERKKLTIYEAGKNAQDDLIDNNILLTKVGLESTDQLMDMFTEFDDIDDQYAKQLAKVKSLEAGVKKYNSIISETSHELKVLNKETEENSRDAQNNTEAVEEQTKSYKDLTDEILAAADAERERLELIEDFNISESEKGTQSAIDAAKESAKKIGEIEIGRIDNALRKEEELKRAKIERLALEQIDEATNAEQVALAYEKRNQALQLLDDELYNKRRQTLEELVLLQETFESTLTGNQINNLLGFEEEYKKIRLELLRDRTKSSEEIEKELVDYRIALLDREIDTRKELGLETLDFELELAELRRQKEEENRRDWIEAGKRALDELGKYAGKYADERIKKQEELIASEQKLLESLQNSADQATLEQGKSITKQEEKIRQAQEEKIRSEKQKQIIEFGTAALTTFTNALDQGKTVPEAFTDVAISQAGLEFILNTLPKFFHGTDDTGTKGLFSDQYGAVTGVTHKNERVITAEDNKKLKGKDNKTVVDAATKYFDLESNNFKGIDPDAYMQMMFIPQVATPVYDDDRMLSRLDDLTDKMDKNTKAIQNLKFPSSKVGQITATAMSIIDDDGKGNSVETLIRNRRLNG